MDKPDDKLAADKDDAAIISECAKRLEVAITMDSENRRDALDDLAFLKGEQWDPIIKAQRARDGRPCLTTNKLPTFLHQVTNSQRQNVPSIKIHPVSDDDMKVAEVVQGAVRHIEYKSNADVAYDTAINSAAAIGFGYFRLITDYCEEASFDQEILFQRIRNPFTVYLGPHVNPDGSDMQWAILTEKIPRTEFVAQYPDKDPCDWNAVTGLGDNAKDWATEHDVRVAEYYRIKQTKETVVLLSNGESGFKKDLLELPEGVSIVQERQGMRKTVQWFKLTGVEIIDQADIPCKWIPVFPVYGDEIDIDGKVQRFGLIRNAKDPQRMYNFWMHQALDTPVATPEGWSTIGALEVGDQVFSNTGELANVIGKSPVYIGKDCYRVTFGDGSEVVSSAEHPWVVEERGARTSGGFKWKTRKLRTDELDPAQHVIKVAGPLELPRAELPIDPYFLGAWLGDGTSACPAIAASDADVETMRAELIKRGLDVGEARKYGDKAPMFTVHGVSATMRDMGLLNNKHIPALYLRASVEQRLELLRGLMDTDGYANQSTGSVAFTQHSQQMTEQVVELVASLGIRCGVAKRAGRVSKIANGQDIVSGESHVVSFTPPAGMAVFSMPRKAEIQLRQRPRHARRAHHKIVSVERVASVPVQCIGIDAPSHLYLCGKSMIPTHNTSATEEVALRPKTPYIGAEGQFEGHEDEWAQANTTSFPYLEYKPKALGGMLAPPPQRQPMADLPVGVMQMAMHANDDIKATTGIFDASLGARSNETSGVAIARRDRQGETANYHYTDNLAITLRHVGRVIIDMWPKIYDGQRTLQIMGRDGKVTGVPINQPIPPEQQKPDPKTGAVQDMLNDMTSAKLSVTVSTGPSYDTLRQEAVEGMIQTAQSWPKLMEIAGDQVVRSMDWPMADEIADRIERTIPQEVRYDKDDPEAGPPPVPPEIQQQIQQYEAALDDAMKQIEAAQSGLDKAQLQAQTQIEVAKINADSRADVEEIKGWIQMLVAQMQPPPGLTAAATDAMTEGEATEAQPMQQPQPAQQAQQAQPQQPAAEPIDFRAILQGLSQVLNPPRRKSIAIQAPSGQTYQGIVADEPDEPAEPSEQ